jgi:predicted DNA-binding protein (MmcQ/YjbR family)
MNIEELREYCLSKKGAEESFPFDEHTLVFKVMGKIFAITGLDAEDLRVNLKCDPEYSIELREQYPEIYPGFHMNKKHWNTVICEENLSDKMICHLIDHSYTLIVNNLPKKIQTELSTEF